MDEYISREELRKHLKECYDDELFDADMKKAVIGIDIYVENMPTADVQPVKHGRWILSDNKYWLTCSFCGAYFDVSCGAPFFYVDNDVVSHINFCPNCGYKQDLDGGDING